ncbi:hypothetical protein PLEOSDRAFT_152527 [Pleurotus ostreatus PC15]|uniref:Uncharacterized protein n=1 Tax=Pleurotus ostreatus (strain PC15) TaxID=1137138 RepID=A0A067P0K9_PLEO1|nr:hypothetical protein PLEOSDRAFT_152527 [Pleurotus ostreatus PC15]
MSAWRTLLGGRARGHDRDRDSQSRRRSFLGPDLSSEGGTERCCSRPRPPLGGGGLSVHLPYADRVDMFTKFWSSLTKFTGCISADPLDQKALLVYQDEQPQLWNASIAGPKLACTLANKNEEVRSHIRSRLDLEERRRRGNEYDRVSFLELGFPASLSVVACAHFDLCSEPFQRAGTAAHDARPSPRVTRGANVKDPRIAHVQPISPISPISQRWVNDVANRRVLRGGDRSRSRFGFDVIHICQFQLEGPTRSKDGVLATRR